MKRLVLWALLALAAFTPLRAQGVAPCRVIDPMGEMYTGVYRLHGETRMLAITIWQAEHACIVSSVKLGSAPSSDAGRCSFTDVKITRNPKTKKVIGLYYRGIFLYRELDRPGAGC